MPLALPRSRHRALLAALLWCSAIFMLLEVYRHFAPGAMSDDSFAILSQARSGVYSDAHPPSMAIIWSIVDKIIPGPLGILLINIFLFYGGLLLIFLWCAKNFGFVSVPLFLLVGLYPSVTAILGVIWIDITMAALYLSAVGIALAVSVETQSKNLPFKIVAAISLILISIGLSLRHNGAAAALPLFSFLIYRLQSNRKQTWFRAAMSLIAGGFLACLCFAGVKLVQNSIVDTKANLWRMAAMYDIVGASFYEGNNLIDSSIAGGFDQSDIEALYSPRSYIPLVLGEQIHALPGQVPQVGKKLGLDFNKSDLDKAILNNWYSVIAKHSGSYVRHRCEVFLSLVGWSPWGLWSTIYDWIPPNELGIPERWPVDSRYYRYVRQSVNKFFFVPAFHLLLSLLAIGPVAYLAIRKSSEPMFLAACLYLSGLLHMFGLFFFAASGDNRYSHWMILTTVLATAIFVAELITSLIRMSRTVFCGWLKAFYFHSNWRGRCCTNHRKARLTSTPDVATPQPPSAGSPVQ